MKKLILFLIIISLLAPVLIEGAQMKWWKDPNVSKELNLSKEQIASLEKLSDDSQKKKSEIISTIQKARLEFKNLFSKDTLTKEDAMVLVEKIADATKSMIKNRLEYNVLTVLVLQKEQRDKLIKMRHACMEKFKDKKGKNRKHVKDDFDEDDDKE